MEKKEIQVFAELILSDFSIKHSQITEYLGLVPFRAFDKGDKVTALNNKDTFIAEGSWWELKSPMDIHASVNDHIKYFIETLYPLKEKFLFITTDVYAKMNIVLTIDNNFTEYFEIEPHILKRLGELNITLAIEIY
ncbi:MAG: DUF4279 domain-containing protein [Ignavibacteria bacterium]|nr:DUF4279 domain-containing protein [Ignavibacteria bacterium]